MSNSLSTRKQADRRNAGRRRGKASQRHVATSARRATASAATVARTVARGVRPGYPAERVVTLRYCQMAQLVSGTGLTAKQQFRLNSAFDPDYTGSGTQPYGFDQWSVLYNHYVVEKAAVTCLVEGYNSAPVIAGLYTSDDQTILGDAADTVAAGGSYGLVHNGSQPTRLELDFDTSKFFDRRNVATDSELRANVGSNPSEVAFCTLFVQDIARTTGLAVGYVITIDYTVRFMEPKDVSPSMLTRPVADPPKESGASATSYARGAEASSRARWVLLDGEDPRFHDCDTKPKP